MKNIVIFLVTLSICWGQDQSSSTHAKVYKDSILNLVNMEEGVVEKLKIGFEIYDQSQTEEEKIIALSVILYYFEAVRNYQKMLEYSKLLAEKSKKNNNTYYYGYANMRMAVAYFQLGFTSQGEMKMDKAFQISSKLPEEDKSKLRSFIYAYSFRVADTLDYIPNKNPPTEYMHKAIKEFKKEKKNKNLSFVIATAFSELSFYYEKMNRLDSALYYNKHIREIQKKKSLPYFMQMNVAVGLAKIYRKQGKPDSAITILEKAKELGYFDNIELKPKSEYYYLLSKQYETIGNNEKYNTYQKRYLELVDSLRQQEKQQINAVSNFVLEENKKNKESQINSWFYTVLGIVVIVVVGLFVLYYVYNKAEKRKT